MREIKFRLILDGQIAGYEKWYPGKRGEMHWIAKPSWLYSVDNENWTPHYILHNHKEQFTGLKDKNGKEIWIGDIYIYQQALVKNGKQIYKEHRVEVKDDIVELYYLSNRAESGKGIYIIGNIHEPELMEKNNVR